MLSFAAHFTAAEFRRRADREPTAIELEYAARLSQILEVIRRALGDRPLVVTSWIRSDSDTAHRAGHAVDVRPTRELSQRAIFDRVTTALTESGIVWGELIFYPFSDWHIHVTLFPIGGRNEVLIADATESEYSAPTPALIAQLPATAAPIAPAQAGTVLVATVGVGLLGAAFVGGAFG